MLLVWFLRLALVAGLLLGWEYASGDVIPEFFVSRPSAIVEVLVGWVGSGRLFLHAGITLVEALSGFIIGGLSGMIVGVILARSRLLGQVLDPFILMFYSLPKVALAPLFVIWFGIGMEMKITLTATIVFFLVFLSTYTGVKNVSRELEAIMRLMGAKERHVLAKVVLPSAVTWVFTGLRLSVPYALIGAIVGELIVSNRGLGYLLSNAAGQFNTAGVFAALAAIVALALLLNFAVRIIERLVMPWQRDQEVREISI